jgi:hypothetical protein
VNVFQEIERTAKHHSDVGFTAVIVRTAVSIGFIVDSERPGFNASVSFKVLEEFGAGWKSDGFDQRERET